jgi:protein SDA1
MADLFSLLSLCFKLFRVHDKLLREMLYTHIIADIKRVNKKGRDNRLNNTLQSFLFGVMTNADSSLVAAKKSLDIMIELYRKKIWYVVSL